MKIFVTTYQFEADYNVMFVNSPFDEAKADLLSNASLTNNPDDADKKVFITDQNWEADIKIMRDNFPR